MLTKEECKKALETLSNPPYESSCGGCICGVSDCGDCPNNKANKLLNQLIHEHFDNPPLTFEEIESGKPIWDNKNKEWLFVNNALSISSEVKGKSYKKFMKVGYKGRRNFLNVEQSEIDFEPNRFYRKEVQDV